MTRTIKVAAIQTSYSDDMKANIAKTERFVREAAGKGAQVILPSELFQGPYFCTSQEEKWFATAYEAKTHPCVAAMAPLAKDLGVVIPVSIYERDGPLYYNSIVIVDRPESVAQARALLESQDVRQKSIQITVETVTKRDLDAMRLAIDWAYRSGGWQIGNIPVPVPGGGVTALGTASARRGSASERAVQTVTVMNDGRAEIATGHEVPFTDVFHGYAAGHGYVATSTNWVAVDTGFEVHPRRAPLLLVEEQAQVSRAAELRPVPAQQHHPVPSLPEARPGHGAEV